MTEDEAKTKTCHKTLIPVGSPDGSAPWFSPSPCLGSACMAWRVEIVEPYQQNDHTAKKRPEGDGWEKLGNFWARTIPEQRIGFCGLVGRP